MKIDVGSIIVTDRDFKLSRRGALELVQGLLGKSIEYIECFRSDDIEPRWVFIVRDVDDFRGSVHRSGNCITVEINMGELIDGVDGPWTF